MASGAGGCYLSVHDRAISTILTSGCGAIVLTIVHGPAVAFYVGWHCYFGVIRICLVSAWGLFVNLFGPRFGWRQPFIAVPPTPKNSIPLAVRHKTGGTKHAHGGHGKHPHHVGTAPPPLSIQVHRRSPRVFQAPDDESHSTDEVLEASPGGNASTPDAQGNSSRWDTYGLFIKERNQSVTFLGFFCLIYSLVWTPVNQVIWLKTNWNIATPLLFGARAISVTMIAMPYTIDTQARYGMALGKLFWSKTLVPRAVNLYMAVANVVLSIILVVLSVRALQVSSTSAVNSPGFYAVAFFALLSPIKSLFKMRPVDAGRGGVSLSITAICDCNLSKALRGLVVLCAMSFLGLITAGPPVGILGSTHFANWLEKSGHFSTPPNITESDVKSLGSWLSCGSESWWEKAVQILP